MVKISESEDDFEVFNHNQFLEAPAEDFSNLPLVEVSQAPEDLLIPEAIGFQRRAGTSLHNLLESQADKAAQSKPPTLPSTQVS